MDIKIEDDAIVIRLIKSQLASATKWCPELDDVLLNEDGSFSEVTVSDADLWMKTVLFELNRESENGSTIVHEMFDKAISNEIDNGAEGLIISGIT